MTEGQKSRWVCVRSSRSYKKVAEAELVLLAMGVEARLQQEISVWKLYAPTELESLAREQLSLYYWENQLKRPMPISAAVVDSGWAGALGYLGVIWGVVALEYLGQIDFIARSNASMVAGLVTGGEWWRTVTALTLHGSFSHILANSVFGVLFGISCGRLFGSGFAWLVILICGAAGNWLNAAVRPDDFVSIGASTATFAAAGLMASFNWQRFRVRGGSLRSNLMPLAGVVALFFFAGIGTERTDVIAHGTGLFCGLIAGVLISMIDLRRLGTSGQWLAGGSALLITLAAWSFAV